MFQSKPIKIRNTLRTQQRENRYKKDNWYLTPPKSQVKLSKWTLYSKFQERFGYDYDTKDSKTLKYMQEDFQNKTFAYLGNRVWTKNLGTKDKYERNLKYGRPLKRNPLLTVFEKLEDKMILTQKMQALNALKSLRK